MVLSTRQIAKLTILALVVGLIGTMYVGFAGANTRKVTFWGAVASNAPIWEAAVEAFEASHPDIEIEMIWRTGNAVEELVLMAASDSMPDAAMIFNEAGFLLGEALVDLSPYIARDAAEMELDDLLPLPTDDLTTVDGRTTGLLWAWFPPVAVYNLNYFQEAGLGEIVEAPTWDEYRMMAERLTRRNNQGEVERYGTYINALGQFRAVVAQAGGRVFSSDYSKLELNSREAIEAAQFLADLIQSGAATTEHWNPGHFAEGTAAMGVGHAASSLRNWAGTVTGDPLTFEWDLFPIPRHLQSSVEMNAFQVGILSGAQDKEAAWEWLKFIQSTEGQKIINVDYLRSVPIRFSLITSPDYLDAVGGVNIPIILEGASSGVWQTPNQVVPTIMNQVVKPAVTSILDGEMAAESAFEQAVSVGNAMIDEMKRRDQ